jgi:hypothetical protein
MGEVVSEALGILEKALRLRSRVAEKLPHSIHLHDDGALVAELKAIGKIGPLIPVLAIAEEPLRALDSIGFDQRTPSLFLPVVLAKLVSKDVVYEDNKSGRLEMR